MDVQWLNTAIGGLIGFGSGVLAEPCRQRLFRPKLAVAFSRKDGGYQETNFGQSAGPDGKVYGAGQNARHVRVRVKNEGRWRARNVRAFVTGIQVRRREGDYVDSMFSDALPLAWSGRGAERFSGIELPAGVIAFVDVISGFDTEPRSLSVHVPEWPRRYETMFTQQGGFRFTVSITAQDVRPLNAQFDLEWNVLWESVRNAQPVPAAPRA